MVVLLDDDTTAIVQPYALRLRATFDAVLAGGAMAESVYT